MRLYEERNNKRDIQCGYCQNHGHNKRHCPTMKAQWDANPQVHETYDHDSLVGIDKTMFPSTWQNYYSDEEAKLQFRRHWFYMKNLYAPKVETKTTKRRKKPKCGFCGSTAHNRRNCNKLKNFVYVLNETNKAYRAAYYDRFIEGMGLGAGALITLRNMYRDDEQMAIMTSFPTEQIMFTNLKVSWSDYSTRAYADLLVGGAKARVDLANDTFYDDSGETDYADPWRGLHTRWGRIKCVTSPAPNRPSKEWFLGQTPCFEWIVKKRDQATLMSELHSLIKHFYPHDNLRTKLGAKIYDQHYTR